MKKTTIIISFLLLLCSVQKALPEEVKNKEGLGFRIGYAKTTSKLDASFGPGLALTLHFIESIHRLVKLDFSLGSFYLGETSREDITEKITSATGYRTKMNVVFFTVSPFLEIDTPWRMPVYFSGGIGIYSVVLLLDSGFFNSGDYQYHPGINARAGLYYKLTPSLRLDFSLSAHRIWTSSKGDDWFFIYSEGDKNPYIYEGSVVVVLFLK